MRLERSLNRVLLYDFLISIVNCNDYYKGFFPKVASVYYFLA